MITIPVYNRAGEKVGEESIDPAEFGGEVNKQLLHDVVVMYQANKRVGTVNTRGRADVAGSGKKLFRQKGTGNARVGAKRTNKRKGGGVAFARRNRDYRYNMPKKAIRTAVRMALLAKFQDGQAVIVEGLGPTGADARPKTQEVARVLAAIRRPDLVEAADTPEQAQARLEHKKRSGRLGRRKREELAKASSDPKPETKTAARKRTLAEQSVLIGLPANDPTLYRSARNIARVRVAPVAEFNALDVLNQRYLLLTREAFAALRETVKTKPTRRAAKPASPTAPAV